MYEGLSGDELAKIPDDEFLADVVIPDHPCPPPKSTEDEWIAEARELEHLGEAFAEDVVSFARQLKATAQASARNRFGATAEAVKVLTRSGMTIAEAAKALGMEEHEAAGVLTRSPMDAPRVLEAEMLLRRHRDWTYPKVAARMHEPFNYDAMARLAELLGLERAARPHIRPERVEELRRQVLDLRERDPKISWSELARVTGVERTTLWKMAKRGNWFGESEAAA